MRNLKKNQRKMFYALFDKMIPQVDENGDETGDPVAHYSAPFPFEASLSSGKGSAQKEVFGTDVRIQIKELSRCGNAGKSVMT